MSSGAPHKSLSKAERIKVYNKYEGRCAYCGCQLEYKDMQVDHVVPLYQSEWDSSISRDDLDTFENYMPACRSCNFYKSTMSLDKFREQLNTLHERLSKIFIYRLAVKYGLITESHHSVKFYFEKYQAKED